MDAMVELTQLLWLRVGELCPLISRTHGSAALAAIANGRRVFAALDDVPVAVRAGLTRESMADRARRVPLHAVLAGTVRGTGGLRVTGPDCATTVAGLFAAGDVASRESISGAVSGFSGLGGAWDDRRVRLMSGGVRRVWVRPDAPSATTEKQARDIVA
ncbi:hypothetical protein OHA40_21615 [Nocardia sp. NBC_00508]|uniref:hypothetical protein n=1 Tax=Nocardia sp. NBC_00508 TaxID=2975992 RepID=UPI002E800134|nr:hypothetical protein [Nocardia sp. NBC_00508]WUD64293.1 hypothetical protein OHA40_21615 [Nocardia sp. NBC_00508]